MEKVMNTHKHHIIPKHMGGTDDPSNLIELTVAEHAEAHLKLYEQYGHWQDEIAWKALSGQITTDQARREATRRTWLGRKHTLETRKRISEGIAKSGVVRGPRSQETKSKISQTLKGHTVSDQTKKLWADQRKGRVVSDATREKIRQKNKGKTLSDEHRQKLKVPKSGEHKKKISDSLKGRKLSSEHRKKCSTNRMGKSHSTETKQKMSDQRKGKKILWDLKNTTPDANLKRKKALTGKQKPVIVCPYCGKSGGTPQMKQWHFDNCKEKK
jgi:hypothetical protein